MSDTTIKLTQQELEHITACMAHSLKLKSELKPYWLEFGGASAEARLKLWSEQQATLERLNKELKK